MKGGGSRGELDLRRAVDAVVRRWTVVAAVAGALVALTLGLTFTQETLYEGRARVLIQPQGTDALFDAGSRDSLDPELVVATEIQILKSDPVRRAVRQELGPVRPVGAGRVGETLVIEVRARDAAPARAARVATRYAEAFIEFRRDQLVRDLADAGAALQAEIQEIEREVVAVDDEIRGSSDPSRSEARLQSRRDALIAQQSVFERRLDELQVQAALKTGGATLYAPAAVPDGPVQPTPIRNGVVAAVAGLVLGVAAAALLEYLNDTIVGKEDLEEATPGLPVVGLLPHVRRTWQGAHTPSAVVDGGSASAEAYRTLRTNILLLAADRSVRVVQITSPRAGEGKTTTATGLALVLAKAGQRVVIVDADLRRGRISRLFDLPSGRGLAGVLAGAVPVEAVIQAAPGHDNVSVVAAGPPPANPSELLAAGGLSGVLRALRERFDIVVVDSAPVLPVTDASLVAPSVDATIVVAASGSTSARNMEAAVEALSRVGAPLAGTVLNLVKEREGYGYRYEYRADATTAGNGSGELDLTAAPSRPADTR